MKNLLFLIFCAASLFLAIYCYRLYSNTQKELALANQRILDRDTTIYQLQKKLGSTVAFNQPKPDEVVASPSTLGKLNTAEVERLKARGLKNPEADLKADLKTKEQTLLNVKAAVGGTMAIRDIQILNDRYALAYFEDGHNGGYMLLRFTVKPANRITWTVLDSYVM